MRTGVKKLFKTSLVPARVWGRQMAAAARKKESVSLSLFLEVHNWGVDEELSTMTTLARPEGVWLGKWKTAEGLKEADLFTFRPGDK